MASGKLFRETPFNGYNRDDVLMYVQKVDEEHKLQAEEAARQLEDVNAKLRTVEAALQEKTAECEALSQQAADTAKTDALEQEILDLRVELQKKEAQSGDTAELEKLLDRTRENLAYKERDLKTTEERLAMYEQLWLQHKENYATYIEVSQNADKILADARKKADMLLADAEDQARKIVERTRSETDKCSSEITENTKSIMTNAVADAQKIIRDAEEKRSLVMHHMQTSSAEFRERFDNLRGAVNAILKEIELADMNLLLYTSEGKDVK